MNEQRRRVVFQAIILVVLIGALAVSATWMIRQINPPRPAQRQPRPATTQAEAPTSETPSATRMPPVPTTSGTTRVPGPSEQLPAAQINPNLFRVHALVPPRNPFVQQEAWYAATLDQVPGYPELRDEEYFETMQAFLPDLEEVLGEDKEFSSISLERSQKAEDYSIEGQSADEAISTRLRLYGPPVEPVFVEWGGAGAEEAPGEVMADFVPQPSTDLFGGEQPALGLGVPGAEMDDLVSGTVWGDEIACLGVSMRGERTSALLDYNGSPYLVTPGTVLPTRYQVVTIQADGVVLLQLRDGSSEWVPLTGAPPKET